MFAYRHDLLKALIADGVKLVVLARHERLADLPEVRNRLAAGKNDIDLTIRLVEYHPELKLLAVGEENVLETHGRAHLDGSHVVRVLAHAVHQVAGLRPVDPNWKSRPRNVWQQYELRVRRLDVTFDQKLNSLVNQAIDAGKWKGTAAVHDPARYWIEGVLAYFDASGQTAAPHDAIHPITTREKLQAYDPDLFALVHETFAFAGKVDWRWQSITLPASAAGNH